MISYETAAVIITNDGRMRFCKPTWFGDIYHEMMKVTDGDHEISSDADSWYKFADIGERFEFREGYIKIIKFNN